MNHQGTKTQRSYQAMPTNLDELGRQIVDSCFQVHKNLGPGLLENIYEEALACELSDRNIPFETQKIVPIQYKHHHLKAIYKLDLIIDGKIVVELKCVERILPIHEAQILTYMKLTQTRLGFLINFNTPVIKDGIKRKAL